MTRKINNSKIDQIIFWILNLTYLISIPYYYINGYDIYYCLSNLVFLPLLAYILKKIVALYYRLPFHQNFKKFYLKNRHLINSESELKKMYDFFVKSESLKFVSYYWNYLNIKNLNQIIKSDLKIDEYALQLGLDYYIFNDFTDDEINQTMKNLAKDNFNIKVNIFKKHNNFNYIQSMKYNNLLLLNYLNLKKLSYFSELSKLNDNGYLCFNDPYIEIEGVKVTSDKITSLFDYCNISKLADLKNIKTILEIGAGSGRTSQAILDLHKNIKYVICDIPAALYVSYKRLSKAFPSKKIGLLYDFFAPEVHGGGVGGNDLNNKKDTKIKFRSNLILEINKYDISFIMPHQLECIKNSFFDLTIAIDCIHEMDKKIIKNYLNNINNISDLFYFSVWKKTTVPFSGIFNFYRNNLNYYLDDYNIPKNWEKKFEEDLIFPSNFIGAGFKIPSKFKY